MPELPEVQTTVDGLSRHVVGLRIIDVWSNYNSTYFKGSETIKDLPYFKYFRRSVLGSKITSVTRRAKNILIHLDTGKSILVHMKMTGHLLYGRYEYHRKNKKDPWVALEPESLKDPFNRYVRFVITFDNDKYLALSDMRRFAKVTLIDSDSHEKSSHLSDIGPEPLDDSFDFKKFKSRLSMRPNGKIKQVLMDQSVIAGIGNIYADESLWRAGIHPIVLVKNISDSRLLTLFKAIKQTLSRGIYFGGDSMSDYRNIHGEKGKFQEKHQPYRRTGLKCKKRGCRGFITRIVVGSRGTHFCHVHQKLN